jgi:hypothetical protein
MGKNAVFILVLILFDGVAVAWGAWEFWSARPDKTAKPMPPLKPASEDAPRHLERQHRLDDGRAQAPDR